MSLIRQRFVPDLIEMLMRSREALVDMNPASETGGNVAFAVRRRSFRLRAAASIPGSFPSCFSSMFALGKNVNASSISSYPAPDADSASSRKNRFKTNT
ncbi:hypothetical protein [Rhizobium sp. 007]|uniref:hypothetical protein n=1 Tax=Rhizobium sp. 007 TaxID=2785056 RepID=UPI0018907E6F|nr:hypothetical protein [Rhizobium sp. 007]QPB19525.1 hypothetical protein ISN39_18470 [Rhizobium sp. 007]